MKHPARPQVSSEALARAEWVRTEAVMHIVQTIIMIIALISGAVLVASVTMQTSKADGFSAAMGGTESGRFRKGSREEMLDRVTKVAAIIWIISCALNAVMWYRMHK